MKKGTRDVIALTKPIPAVIPASIPGCFAKVIVIVPASIAKTNK